MHVLNSKHNTHFTSLRQPTTLPQTSRPHHDGDEIMTNRISSTKRLYSCTLTLDTLHVTILDSINGDDTRFHGRVHHKTGINSGSRIFRHLDHGHPLPQNGEVCHPPPTPHVPGTSYMPHVRRSQDVGRVVVFEYVVT